MLRTRCLLVVVLMLSTAALSQQPQSQPTSAEQTPTFQSRSTLVLVPVIVKNGSGKHISGLSKDAFRLEEDGKVRSLSVFEEIKTEKPDAEAVSTRLAGYSNFASGDMHQHRLTIIVVDKINTPFLRQAQVKKELIQYLAKSLNREEPVTLLGLSRTGLQQLHSFTTDTGMLIKALNKAKNEVSSAEINDTQADSTRELGEDLNANAAGSTAADAVQTMVDFMNKSDALASAFQQRDAIRATLVGLEQIARAYAAFPGRKTLIWASSGFPFIINDPLSFGNMDTSMVALYERTWRALDSSNIAVYPIDVRGMFHPDFEAGGGMSASSRGPVASNVGQAPNRGPGIMNTRMPYNKINQQQATLEAFAQATGGQVCMNMNDLGKCVAAAVDDSRAYYMLGYYLGANDTNPGWRKLKVKVSAGGAHVRSRQGFYVATAPPDTPEARRKELFDAIYSPLESTGMLLNVRQLSSIPSTKPAGEPATTHFEFMIAIVGKSLSIDRQNENKVDLTVLTAAIDKNGKVAAVDARPVWEKLQPEEKLQKIVAGTFGVRQRLELPMGKYQVKCAVLDNFSRQIGTVSLPLEVK